MRATLALTGDVPLPKVFGVRNHKIGSQILDNGRILALISA